MSIHVVARLVARPEAVAAAKEALAGLLAPTRREAGCIRYELFQNREDSTDFTFTEEWADDASLDAHLGSAHLAAVRARAEELFAAAPDIRRYGKVG